MNIFRRLFGRAQPQKSVVAYQQVVLQRYCLGHGHLAIPMAIGPVSRLRGPDGMSTQAHFFYSWKCGSCKAEVSATVEEYATVSRGKPN